MARTINEVTLYGNVGKDPEIKSLDNGVKVATFSLATSTGGYKKADGTEVKEVTQWHNIVAWRNLADICEKYIRKGDKPIVRGMVTYRSYEKDGQKFYVTEILANDISLTGGKKEAQQDSPQAQQVQQIQNDNDDLPF